MKRGFTLVETLLAFGLLLVTAIFVFQMLPASILATRQAEVRVEAQRILNDNLEAYRSRNFDSLTPGRQQLAPVAGQLGVTFQPTVTVAKLEDADPDRALEVQVDVAWEFRSRECHLRGGTALWRVQH
ncbi:hypothetical protein ABS71_06970 [bacterium SCN 62-11]|nr:type II secretion system protein [Candidatus Eremiobacteraeota bacterium]ODT73550.1 MAG: hypothetical protein ABS71_06970 [bacterium SCN 62-11]